MPCTYLKILQTVKWSGWLPLKIIQQTKTCSKLTTKNTPELLIYLGTFASTLKQIFAVCDRLCFC